MRNLTFIFLFTFLEIACSELFAGEEASMVNIVVSHGKYSDYYHLKYKLTNNNFVLSRHNNEFTIENGQFEIFIDQTQFPISAPNCKDRLILRMPATLKSDKNYIESIQRKELLYKEIKSVYQKKIHSLTVIIELNPYVKVTSRRPLELELENCNIFFRTRKNHYIDTLN